MKIIHIVENLHNGAVENWLVRTFLKSREIRPEWQWTFYCILGKEGRLDEQVRESGGTIIYAPVTISQKLRFLQHLRTTLRTGQFDIIHAHHDYLSGFYLLATLGIKPKKTILHIHNTDKALPVGNPLLRKSLLRPFKVLALFFSDTIIGISRDTLQEFLGKAGSQRFNATILYYGVDFTAYEKEPDRPTLLQALDLPETAKLLLFAGRMNPQKNPLFVLDILQELLKTRKDIYTLFLGTGDLEPVIYKKAKNAGILANIRQLGWRDDPTEIFKCADIFVFPRVEYPKEGLGLVVVEAQAAGLPMVISHGICKDAIVIKALTHYLPNICNSRLWANEINKILTTPPEYSKKDALEQLNDSVFALTAATQKLLSIYES